MLVLDVELERVLAVLDDIDSNASLEFGSESGENVIPEFFEPGQDSLLLHELFVAVEDADTELLGLLTEVLRGLEQVHRRSYRSSRGGRMRQR